MKSKFNLNILLRSLYGSKDVLKSKTMDLAYISQTIKSPSKTLLDKQTEHEKGSEIVERQLFMSRAKLAKLMLRVHVQQYNYTTINSWLSDFGRSCNHQPQVVMLMTCLQFSRSVQLPATTQNSPVRTTHLA